ncbi:MAG: DUF484 family protein [Pseudomonadota bacterium]
MTRKAARPANDLDGDTKLRARILADPDLVLNDPEIMRALLGPVEAAGRNVVDLRAALIAQLEHRLGALSAVHRDVVAAARDNMSGMEQVHRAALAVLDAPNFEAFLDVVSQDFRQLLAIDVVRFCLEASEDLSAETPAIVSLEPGALTDLLSRHAGPADGAQDPLQVLLRGDVAGEPLIFGPDAERIQSEAWIRLDFGPTVRPGLLAFGAFEPTRFSEDQATDLLTFLGGVVERSMRGWLALAG